MSQWCWRGSKSDRGCAKDNKLSHAFGFVIAAPQLHHDEKPTNNACMPICVCCWCHMQINSHALATIGPHAELLLGHSRFMAVYVTGALAGTAASYLLTPLPSVGASGEELCWMHVCVGQL